MSAQTESLNKPPQLRPNLYLRYRGCLPENDSQIGLAELGQSLVGFDALVKDLFRILRFDSELEVKVTASKEGSVVVEVLAFITDGGSSLPFESVGDMLDFLKITGDVLHEQAQSYFNAIGGGYRALNDWAAKNPIDFAVLAALIGKAIQTLIKKAKKQKAVADLNDPELPRRIAEELHKLILKNGFKRLLSPLIEAEVETIEVSAENDFKDAARIDVDNLPGYLAEEEMILPNLANGDVCNLIGIITSLKSTRGDSLTFQTKDRDKTYNLETLPPPGQTSKNFKNLYRETINLEAQVYRKSLYQKPKLQIIAANLCQAELGLSESPNEPADDDSSGPT